MPALKTRILSAASAALLLGFGATAAGAQSVDQYCDSVARDYASQYARTGQVIGGAIGGAVTGAILGGIFGGKKGAGTGAAIGGGVGALGGAANQSNRWQWLYHHAFNDCMAREAGGPVGPAASYAGGPEPWTDEWYDYCASKYRSFNPQTGMFLAYSGEYKPCQ